MDNFEAVLNDPDGHQFLAVVAAVHHERVDQSLNNWALSLAESLGSITARAVGQELGELLLASNVILKKSWDLFNYFYLFLVQNVILKKSESRDLNNK